MNASIICRRDKFDQTVSAVARGIARSRGDPSPSGSPMAHHQALGELWEQFKNFEIDDQDTLEKGVAEILKCHENQ